MWAAERGLWCCARACEHAELANIVCPVPTEEFTSSCCRIAPVSEYQMVTRRYSSGARKCGQSRFGSLPARDSAVCLVRTLDPR